MQGATRCFVAGGTDLYPNMKRRQQTPKTVISVTRLRELHQIRGDAGSGDHHRLIGFANRNMQAPDH